MPGTSPGMTRKPDSIFKQPTLRRPCCWRRGRRRRLISRSPKQGARGSRPPKNEGSGAPRRRFNIPRLRSVARVLRSTRPPLGAPLRLFCPRDRASGHWTEDSSPSLAGQLSPPFVRAASSHQRQPPVVGADGGAPQRTRSRNKSTGRQRSQATPFGAGFKPERR